MKTGKKSGFSQLWRRNAVVAAIALFVCAAVYLNWSYEQQQAETGKTLGESTMVDGKTGDALLGDGKTQTGTTGAQDPDAQPQADPKEGTATSAPVSSYFATARLNRQQARDSALSLLQDAAGEEADQTMRDQANESIQTMADYTVTEAQIENLVVAKGYADCGLHWRGGFESGGGRARRGADRCGYCPDCGRGGPGERIYRQSNPHY